MDSSKTSALVEAKNEYIRQLAEDIQSPVMRIFNKMYARNKKLVEFQKALQEIPHWNQATVEEHATPIVNSCTYFDDLLTAVFVTFVRILTTVRLSSNKPDVNIKIPKNEHFIHRVLIECAKEFYGNPYIFKDKNEAQKRDIYRASIDIAIRQLLPVKAILEAYLGTSVSAQGDVLDESELFSTPPAPEEQTPFEDTPVAETPFDEGDGSPENQDDIIETPIENEEDTVKHLNPPGLAVHHQDAAAAHAEPASEHLPPVSSPRVGGDQPQPSTSFFDDAEDI